jgi:hypothetical protein
MRVDVKATNRAWRQTVWGTVLATVGLLALTVYFWAQPTPDYASVRFLLILLVDAAGSWSSLLNQALY